MDPKHRVYYFVNLNQNYKRGGWWSKGWDDFGRTYRANLNKLKAAIASLKIRPNVFSAPYQMLISCWKDEEPALITILHGLEDTNFIKINP